MVIDGTGDGHVIYQAGAKYEKGGSKHKGGMQSPALCFELSNVDYDKSIAYLEQNPEEYGVPDTFEGMRQNISFLKDNVCFNVYGLLFFSKESQSKRGF